MLFIKKKKVLILGAGFSGMQAAKCLSPKKYVVKVIDRSPYFEFLPNIHELVSGAKSKASLRVPLAEAVTRLGHEFIQDEIKQIDPVNKKVKLSDCNLEYDALLVALGGVNATFGIPGVDEYAYPFKTVEECAAIGQRLQNLSVNAKPFHVVIVGGGFEGIEALGEVLRRYKDAPRMKVSLVEGSSQLMPGHPSKIDVRLRELVKGMNVEFHTSERVAKVEPDKVHLQSGKVLPSDITIWTGGVAPPALVYKSALSKKPTSWMPAKRTLQSEKYPKIFIAGDVISLSTLSSKQAYDALDMGQTAAENISRYFAGRKLKEYKPAVKPMLVSFGDISGFFIFGPKAIEGVGINLLKEMIFHLVMGRFDLTASPTAVIRMAKRTETTLNGLFYPTVTSMDKMKNLFGLKIISWM